jgi:hypothetical protein
MYHSETSASIVSTTTKVLELDQCTAKGLVMKLKPPQLQFRLHDVEGTDIDNASVMVAINNCVCQMLKMEIPRYS